MCSGGSQPERRRGCHTVKRLDSPSGGSPRRAGLAGRPLPQPLDACASASRRSRTYFDTANSAACCNRAPICRSTARIGPCRPATISSIISAITARAYTNRYRPRSRTGQPGPLERTEGSGPPRPGSASTHVMQPLRFKTKVGYAGGLGRLEAFGFRRPAAA